MPSRRQVLAAVGTLPALAGCTADATTGTVTRKRVDVTVPRDGQSVETSVATLAYEPDRNLIHGEYDPTYVDASDGTLSIASETHRRLDDRFGSVTYEVNVVPPTGTPASGRVVRPAYNALSLGGDATVVTTAVGRLDVRETTPRTGTPNMTIARFDVESRLNGA